MESLPSFQCSRCGETIDGAPLSWQCKEPDIWSELSDEARRKSELSSDQCVIEGRHFLIRGVLELPIVDLETTFSWGVWVSLSESNFLRASDLWYDDSRIDEPAYFGWLCNSIPDYPETLHLKTRVHARAVGLRPSVELEPTDDPLAVKQRNGIQMERIRWFAERMHHSDWEGNV